MTNISIKQTTPHISIRASGKQGIQGKSAYDIAVEQGFVGTEAEWIAQLATDAELALKADKATTYTKVEVDTALAGKAETIHVHTISEVTGLQSALDSKANTVHTHVASDVTDFNTSVSNNSDVSANTAARHTHANKAILDATSASYTTAEKTKLGGIQAGAQVNEVSAADLATKQPISSASSYWANIYAKRYFLNPTSYIDGSVAGRASFTGDITLTGILRPSSNLSQDFGLSTNYWRNAFSKRVTFNATSYIDGGTAGLAALVGDLSVSGGITQGGLPVALKKDTAPKVVINSPLPFAPTVDVLATNRLIIIGIDKDNNRLFARDGAQGFISQSDDWGATWTHLKARPTNIRYNNMVKMVSFSGHFYLTADDANGVWHIYRCPEVTAGGSYVWETSPVFSYRANANNAVRTAFTATSSALFAGEYCNVTSLAGGPSIYRSTDGVTWQAVYTDTTARHIHAVKEDPYNQGHVYATIGDNNTSNCIIKSENGGITWNTVISSATNLWQSVQISFSPKWVWLAMDRIGGTVAVFDRTELVPRIAASNLPHNMAVPGASASTDRFYMIGYFGCVDPETESYYLAVQDTSSAGNKFGLFWLPHVGGELKVLDVYPTGAGLTEVFINQDTLWAGTRTRPLIKHTLS